MPSSTLQVSSAPSRPDHPPVRNGIIHARAPAVALQHQAEDGGGQQLGVVALERLIPKLASVAATKVPSSAPISTAAPPPATADNLTAAQHCAASSCWCWKLVVKLACQPQCCASPATGAPGRRCPRAAARPASTLGTRGSPAGRQGAAAAPVAARRRAGQPGLRVRGARPLGLCQVCPHPAPVERQPGAVACGRAKQGRVLVAVGRLDERDHQILRQVQAAAEPELRRRLLAGTSQSQQQQHHAPNRCGKPASSRTLTGS